MKDPMTEKEIYDTNIAVLERIILTFAKQMRDDGAAIFNDETLKLYVKQFVGNLDNTEINYPPNHNHQHSKCLLK